MRKLDIQTQKVGGWVDNLIDDPEDCWDEEPMHWSAVFILWAGIGFLLAAAAVALLVGRGNSQPLTNEFLCLYHNTRGKLTWL